MSLEQPLQNNGHVNNFDLIRLFAAVQVAVVHSATHLNVAGEWVDLFSLFPGVPIFFFISGFLIYQSWKNISGKKYLIFFKNRALRIFPGLYFCIAITVISLLVSGFISTSELTSQRFWFWVVTQASVFQFFNPEFLRTYGVGVVNGSLWTISVELQFYILTPIIFLIFSKKNGIACFVIILFLVINLINSKFNAGVSIFDKIIGVSFLPWIGMFAFGAYVSTSKKMQALVFNLHWVILVFSYLAFYLLSMRYGWGSGNSINPISFIILSAIILKFAFYRPMMSYNLLGKNDISYGVYIFHMPIVNFLLYKNIDGLTGFWIAIICTFVLAAISWFLVERPALRMKKISIRSV